MNISHIPHLSVLPPLAVFQLNCMYFCLLSLSLILSLSMLVVTVFHCVCVCYIHTCDVQCEYVGVNVTLVNVVTYNCVSVCVALCCVVLTVNISSQIILKTTFKIIIIKC